MSHPFGDLLSQYLHRKHGLSQAKLAAGILQGPAVITKMCQGQRLSGSQARERVVMILGWLQTQHAIETVTDANALLIAAGMAPLRGNEPTERALLGNLQPQSLSTPSPTLPRPAMAPREVHAVASEPRSTAFGRLLQEYRLRAGLTQEALAERAGLGRRSIQGLERGESMPLRDTLQRLIQALALSPQEGSKFADFAKPSRRRPVLADFASSRESSPGVRPAEHQRHNLPTPLTSFIGRDQEIADIKCLLTTTRLLTLAGAGGCGKTRLALQVAADLVDAYPDGVWLVDLAPVADPALVVSAVAIALAAREEASRSIEDVLVPVLRHKCLLLVLDNCEHLIVACARLADTLLRTCPEVRILATSREALRIPGEVSWRVPSLGVPHLDRDSSLDAIATSEAVRLFVERASAVRPGFSLSNDIAPAIARICFRLDGIPLALELAAARVRVLPLDEIATRLDQSLRLLTDGSRVALPRQQTLRATLTWSYELLSGAERTLFNRLAVFAGGFTLEAAEAVCGDASLPDILDLLTWLLDRSLVEIEPRTESPGRYHLLETLRQYGMERLVEAGELETFHARHAAYYQAFVVDATPKLQGAQRKAGFDRLEREHDNLRAALRFLVDCQDADGVSRFCDAVVSLWWTRYNTEGRAWLAEIMPLVKASGSAADYARVLRYDARLAHRQSNWADAVARLNQSLAIWRQLGDRAGMAGELARLGLVARSRGDYPAARSFFEESLGLSRDLGLEADVGQRLEELATLAVYRGDDATARALVAESLMIQRRLGDPYWLGWALRVAGMVAHGDGDLAVARLRIEEALTTWRELDYREGVALVLGDYGDLLLDLDHLAAARSALTESLTLWRVYGGYMAIVEHDLECFGGLAVAEGDGRRAVRLWGAAAALRERLEEPQPPDLKARLERRMAPVKEALSADAFRQAWSEGQAMSVEQAVTYALSADGG